MGRCFEINASSLDLLNSGDDLPSTIVLYATWSKSEPFGGFQIVLHVTCLTNLPLFYDSPWWLHFTISKKSVFKPCHYVPQVSPGALKFPRILSRLIIKAFPADEVSDSPLKNLESCLTRSFHLRRLKWYTVYLDGCVMFQWCRCFGIRYKKHRKNPWAREVQRFCFICVWEMAFFEEPWSPCVSTKISTIPQLSLESLSLFKWYKFWVANQKRAHGFKAFLELFTLKISGTWEHDLNGRPYFSRWPFLFQPPPRLLRKNSVRFELPTGLGGTGAPADSRETEQRWFAETWIDTTWSGGLTRSLNGFRRRLEGLFRQKCRNQVWIH